jgi:hypothetical protein
LLLIRDDPTLAQRPTGPAATPNVLRPALRERVIYLLLTAVAVAISAGALFYNPVVGAAAVLVFGFAAINAAFRIWHPRSYATELDDDGFRTFGAWGQLVHEVRWDEVAHLTVFHGNGLRVAGTVLAWRCEPRRRRRGLQPAVKGGRNRVGEEFDGALPDDYLGIEPMLVLFQERADAARDPSGS